MSLGHIIRLSNLYYYLSKKSDKNLPEDSKDLKTVLSNLDNLSTYTDRKEYAERNLKHLSSGSSRVVFLTPEKTVIKLAKNDKGIAQNKAEGNPDMKSKYINTTINKSKNNVWLETHFLDKITEKEFEKMTGIPFQDFGDAIRYGLKNVSGSSYEKPKGFEKVANSDIYKEMFRLGKQFKLMPGDLARISSWGTKDNKIPILIDAGLTANVFEKFYEDSTSS